MSAPHGGWKPGDLAVITISQGDVGAMRTATGDWAWVSPDARSDWQGLNICSASGVRARPLVAADPESWAGVDNLAERVVTILERWGRSTVDRQDLASALQIVLRGLADRDPGKPDEPFAQYAVVRDVDGQRWFRTRADGLWHNTTDAHGRYSSRPYAEIRVVEVLFEGVA